MYVLWRVIVKEFLQLRQDRRILSIVFLAPVVQLVAFGYAANLDVTDVPLLVVDRDGSPTSRRLVDEFTASRYFYRVGTESSVADVDPWLVRGEAQVVLVIGEGYGRAVATGATPSVQLLADGSDSTAAGIGLGYASGILGRESARLVSARAEELLRAATFRGIPDRRASRVTTGRPSVGGINMEPRVWYNPDLRTRWFYVPAVLAMVLMIITMVLSSMGVVREKEIGTMEQVIVTPVRSWQLIVGKLFPFAVIGLIDTCLVSAIAVGWFQVPLRSGFPLLVGLTMLFLLNTLALGLLVSTLVRTQQQAMMIAAFGLMLPMIYLSGLIFPIANMPRTIQLVTYAIPLRYYATILRGVFLRGAGLDVLWPQAAVLAGTGVLLLAVASLRFRKRLD